jgi:hypothetical protein
VVSRATITMSAAVRTIRNGSRLIAHQQACAPLLRRHEGPADPPTIEPLWMFRIIIRKADILARRAAGTGRPA